MIERRLLRSLILETFKKHQDTQIAHVISEVERLVKERDLFPNQKECESKGIDFHYYERKNFHPKDILTIGEIAWDLIQERIITPGNTTNPHDSFPFLRITQFGKDYISKTSPNYYDPQGYMEDLKNVVPSLDPVIAQYISESMNCFRQQLYFASAVMIGAAAEKAVLLLLQTIHDSLQKPTDKKKLAKLLERPNLPEIYNIIIKTIEPLIESNKIPYTVHRGCTEHLISLFEMIRVQRNDAIHPTNGKVDRTKVFLSLQTIPTGLECIYKIIDWFKSNPIP
jgi:hypothetical protein